MTDFRALCAELLQELEHASAWDYQQGLKDQARAALAQPEPQGIADEEAWQWYSYCPEEGIELQSSKELAQKTAQEIMGSYAKAAYSDGWHEDMESVSWGMLLPVEQAQVVERTKAEPDSEFDEWIRYELVSARYARPAIEPVPTSERLPKPEDCDAEGLCWLHQPHPATPETPEWRLMPARYASTLYGTTHWLPHWALPVPGLKGE
jgi:hypothetical protein